MRDILFMAVSFFSQKGANQVNPVNIIPWLCVSEIDCAIQPGSGATRAQRAPALRIRSGSTFTP